MLNNEQLKKKVLDEFDFEKVHKVMVFLNWEYHGMGIPSVEYLEHTANSLIDNALKMIDGGSSSTGGFLARAGKTDTNGDLSFLSLNFILTGTHQFADLV